MFHIVHATAVSDVAITGEGRLISSSWLGLVSPAAV